MTNDECQMTNEARMRKPQDGTNAAPSFRFSLSFHAHYSLFVVRISFVIWHSSFVIRLQPLAGFAVTFGLLLAIAAHSATVEIQLPPEVNAFKQDVGAEIANAQCLVCHSVEYVATQPPFPRTFWASSVKKMREKYGAQIPDSQVEPLLDYLVQNYGVKTSGTVTTSTSTPANTTDESKTPEALGFKYGCILCHGVDKKIVGPAFKDIAAKYRADPTAVAKITEQVHKGGSGKWGPALMPPFPMVTDDEIKTLSDWILSQR
jgi:cytochrome c551/c552